MLVDDLTPDARERAHDRDALLARYREVRNTTLALCEPLQAEDFVVQSMPDASPTKWHLAHTSWFFETFLLTPADVGYEPYRREFSFLFNSYYNAVGERLARPKRGLLTRPAIGDVLDYRRHVDLRMQALLAELDDRRIAAMASTLVLGLNHEQQHQELILTDIKHAFANNPMRPAYRAQESANDVSAPKLRWTEYPEGVRWIGHEGARFAFDNELPRHRQFLEPFALGSRLVTNGEYLAFMEDAGYGRPELWLSDGWNTRNAHGWEAPLYWERHDGAWHAMTLGGMRPLAESEPVCHVSFYEADAFARWAGLRLPTEAEWEVAAEEQPVCGNLLERGRFHPAAADGAASQLYGDVWEWTASPYVGYPGFAPSAGAIGEYNGKFMCNQFVLRGGSCVTPQSHIRRTYRNFFPPDARWQFSGIRLAKWL